MPQQPELQGPLKNPDWTDEQNRNYDIGENFRTPEQAREVALGATHEVNSLAQPEVDDAITSQAVAKARKLVEPKSSSRPKPRRPAFGRAADTADSDRRVKDQYDLYK